MLDLIKTRKSVSESEPTGEFLTFLAERYYVIRNIDRMPPFLVSVISSADHWLFISSTGGLTAGRVSADSALFPYVPVDKVHESTLHTGSKTVLRVSADQGQRVWEPFNREHDGRYVVSRNLYKTVSGDKLCFEEVNHDLQLAFRYTWATSDEFGFCRRCGLSNLGKQQVAIELLDGLQNILPANMPMDIQTRASNLVDAYKWTEFDEDTGLAIYALYSSISDQAEPSESLRANTVFCLGLDQSVSLISSAQLDGFRTGQAIQPEFRTRGIRGAYFVNASLDLAPGGEQCWQMIANIEQSQADVVALQDQLRDPARVAIAIDDSVADGTNELARIMASTDALQLTAEENVSAHHYANVLFNNLRGGIFDDQNNVLAKNFANFVFQRNRVVFDAHSDLFGKLPAKIDFESLLANVRERHDRDLERLCYEYLPIRFGRRHGDPSRPWNKFAIDLKDERGNRRFSYEGNWRDIFQNWEALGFSYPAFADNIIAKFVNASTIDGHNPYRISQDGIDWEVEEPEDPWSYIGYWGDHQIIYLLKLLELSSRFHPGQLAGLLRRPVFSYANVPYRIKPFTNLLDNPKSTIDFDHKLADEIAQRVEEIGADGRLVLNADGSVYNVNLLEKLLVALLGKLGNFVVGGGIWLNTQRPEWNDANNALVGHGLSMVTLYYMRRYVRFLQQLVSAEHLEVELSTEVANWIDESTTAMNTGIDLLGDGKITPQLRFDLLRSLGSAAGNYREAVYREVPFSGRQTQPIENISSMLDSALVLIDQSIDTNRRDDGLYHAYNLLKITQGEATVDALYPMLEGQVAVLSAGIIDADEAGDLLHTLFESDVYRPDQSSFMLYPDRQLPSFLEKNRVPADEVEIIPLLQQMLADGDTRLITRDMEGTYRLHADFANIHYLNQRLDELVSEYGGKVDAARTSLQALYEKVFQHRTFTGRSGSMFGFEGLGCIHWHMVSKLLLAIQENFFAALDGGVNVTSRNRLAHYYYRVRDGIGFHKTPSEYGAFPADPYSHTPKHAGAQQPGMTGQVKEEILTRFGELGVRVVDGTVRIQPNLLRACEFLGEPREFRFLDVHGNWQHLTVPVNGLCFTWCQVPFVYKLDDDSEVSLSVIAADGTQHDFPHLELPAEDSAALFRRDGRVRQIAVTFSSEMLFTDQGAQIN
jgi:hypothetical protein